VKDIVRVDIAKDFSPFPAGRYLKDGPFPGERFRAVLVDLFKKARLVVVGMDGTIGYGSSFLEEAFGGLVRREGFTADELRTRLRLESTDPAFSTEAWGYVNDAKPDADKR
jgi:hypothetical protein